MLEAVFEEMGVKKQVFGELEDVVSAECILATNTSSLSITEMGADLQHPERLVGLHFFNPVKVLPLVELIRTDETDDVTVATTYSGWISAFIAGQDSSGRFGCDVAARDDRGHLLPRLEVDGS